MNLADLPSLAHLPADGILTPEETATYLRVSTSTLQNWRTRPGQGNGLPYIRLSGGKSPAVRYVVGDVREFLKQQKTSNSTDTSAAA